MNPATPPAATGAVDSHTHLNHPRLRRRVPELLHRARQAGVGAMLVVGYDLETSRLAVELAQTHENLWAAVGFHPHEARNFDRSARDNLRALARQPRVAAIGETGLDFFRDLSPRDQQCESFLTHLRLARELALPVIVHCRSAQEEMLSLAEREGAEGWVWHCFEGSAEQAGRAVTLGMWIGLAGTVTYEGGSAAEAVAVVPWGRMLVETDCPYLSPAPCRSRDNEPANLPAIAAAIARKRGVELEEVIRVTAENACAALSLRAQGATSGRG